jgi:NDP-sugar pyrophosphorylase family protein
VSLPVAVLAGGMATRMRPMTASVPKILLDIGGRPFAERQLEVLQRWDIREVVYCLGYLSDQVMAALGDGARWGMKFTYVLDGPRPLGTGGAIRRALPFLGSAFFVMYGDSYLRCDFTEIERAFTRGGTLGLMTVFRNEGRWDRSNVAFEDGRIARYDKTSDDPSLRYIDYGLGVLTPKAFEPWAADEAFDLAIVYQHLVEMGELTGYEVSERFYEIGSLEGLAETRALFETEGGIRS